MEDRPAPGFHPARRSNCHIAQFRYQGDGRSRAQSLNPPRLKAGFSLDGNRPCQGICLHDVQSCGNIANPVLVGQRNGACSSPCIGQCSDGRFQLWNAVLGCQVEFITDQVHPHITGADLRNYTPCHKPDIAQGGQQSYGIGLCLALRINPRTHPSDPEVTGARQEDVIGILVAPDVHVFRYQAPSGHNIQLPVQHADNSKSKYARVHLDDRSVTVVCRLQGNGVDVCGQFNHAGDGRSQVICNDLPAGSGEGAVDIQIHVTFALGD